MSSAVVAAASAVLAAGMLATAGVAQRRAALAVPEHRAGDPRLVAALLARGWWWTGTLSSIVGLGLQFLALASGSIILVQSLLTSSIVWSVLVDRVLSQHRPARRVWCGVGLTAVGLVGLLVALSPTAPVMGVVPPAGATLVLALGCVALMAVAVARRSAHPGRLGGLAPALATGVGYGVTAVCLKTVGTQLGAGWLGPFGHPALYVALVVGPFSILLSQSALQQAHALATVMIVILVVDPVVGLVTGVAWFGEHVTTAPAAVAGAVACVVVLTAGMATTLGASPTARPAGPASSASPT